MALPAGFVPDAPASAGLPAGFVPDAPAKKTDPRFVDNDPAPEDRIGKANRGYAENVEALKQPLPGPTAGHAALGGALQGVTMHAFPMLSAAIAHPVAVLPWGDRSAYTNARNETQQSLDADKAAHSVAAGAGEFAGGIGAAMALPGSGVLSRVAQATGMAAATGANDVLSHGGTTGEALKQGAVGGAEGLALAGVPAAIGKGMRSGVTAAAGGATHLAGNIAGAENLYHAAMSALTGQPVEAMKHLGVYAAAKLAPKAIAGVRQGMEEAVASGTGPIAALAKAASMGNEKAIVMAKKLGISGLAEKIGQAAKVQSASQAVNSETGKQLGDVVTSTLGGVADTVRGIVN